MHHPIASRSLLPLVSSAEIHIITHLLRVQCILMEPNCILLLLSLQKPIIEELLDEDARHDTLAHLRPIITFNSMSPIVPELLMLAPTLRVASISSPIRLLSPTARAFFLQLFFTFHSSQHPTRIIFIVRSLSPPSS
ncbi:hypothetical protein BDR03DRAFT_970442 [Suillus americanus]|nr:hypothetical protein BDR03DRAFT_970442 [Suillus americanus]